MKIFLPLFVMLSVVDAFAQNAKIDSLLALLQKDKADTNQIIHLNFISQEYADIGEYDSALNYSNRALQLFNTSPFKGVDKGVVGKLKAKTLGNIGSVHDDQGDYPKALEYYFKALKINEELVTLSVVEKKTITTSILNSIGLAYHNQGNYPQALEYFFRSLKINEDLVTLNVVEGKSGMATNLGNIGMVYHEQGELTKALEYFFRALKIAQELDNKNGIARHFGNIGVIYRNQNDFPKALEYYLKALKMDEELGNKYGIARHLGNIGVLYDEQAEFQRRPDKAGRDSLYNKALGYYFKALEINEELGRKSSIAIWLGNIGFLYTKQKKYDEAEQYLLRSLSIAGEIGSLEDIKAGHRTLSELYFAKGSAPITSLQRRVEYYKKAYEHYEQYSIAKDSLFNIEKEQDITRKEMNFEFEKKEAVGKAEQDKKEVVAEAEKRKQQIIIWSVVSGLLLVVVFAGFMFKRFKVTQKQKNIITLQKTKVDEAYEALNQQNEEIAAQRDEIQKQKHKVEEHQKEIIDSITYAKRLQEAILPSKDFVTEHLPENFILYKPKDLVAGDFYWAESVGNKFLIAAADSTGHGVPGAMVSVVCSNALNRSLKEFGLTEPGQLLDKTRELVLETFSKSSSDVKDGMDISLLSIEHENVNNEKVIIKWSGANNPLWYVSPSVGGQGEDVVLQEIKANKQPIGKTDNPTPFTTHEIEYVNGTTFYLLTDGYADQFGGPKGKKFKYKQLEELLIANANLELSKQSEILNAKFNEWKDDLEQVDDVCIIGIKI